MKHMDKITLTPELLEGIEEALLRRTYPEDKVDYIMQILRSHEGLVNALKAIRLRSNDSSNGFLEAIYSIAEEALNAVGEK